MGRRRARIEERVLRRKPLEREQSFRLLLGLALEAMVLALPSGSLGPLSKIFREARRAAGAPQLRWNDCTPSAHASSRETEVPQQLRVSFMFPP